VPLAAGDAALSAALALVAAVMPLFFNLRANPFEVGPDVADVFFSKEKSDRLFLILPAVGLVSEYIKTFEKFPPRARPASFSIDQALEKARAQEAELHAAATKG
jgi:hypothetical protein